MWITDLWYSSIWGVRFYILFYFILGVIALSSTLIYWYRERIRRKYYEIRFPEKIVRVIIHYSGNMFKIYYRLIPEQKTFTFENKDYVFSDKEILKNNKFFSNEENNEEILTINNKRYKFSDVFLIKKRWEKYPEIHYFYNSPNPISFDAKNHKIQISAFQLKDIHDNDLMKKLLTLEGEKSILKMLMLVSLVGAIASSFCVAKLMGWI